MHALETRIGRSEKRAKEAREAQEKTPEAVFKKQQAEKSAGEFAKRYQETQEAAQSAGKSDAILNSTLEALQDPSVYTGIRGDTVLDVKKAINGLKDQFPTIGAIKIGRAHV